MNRADNCVERLSPRLALSIAETAAAIGVSKPTVYKLIEKGRLKTVRAGTRQIVTAQSLQDFLS